MFAAIRNNSSYILILGLWSVVGMINTPLAGLIIITNLLLFFRKEMYYQALFGFFFLLALSDNTQSLWNFAKVIKPFYLITLSAFLIVKSKDLIHDLSIPKSFIPFLLVAILSMFIGLSSNFFIATQKTLSYGLILIAIPNIVLLEYKRYGNTFFANLVAFSLIIHLISFSVIFLFPEVGTSHGGRWRGMFGNPNGLGLYLILFYPLYRIIKHEWPGLFNRTESLIYLGITFLLLWMSGSRTALLSIFAFEIAYKGFQFSKGLTLILLASIMIYFNQIYDGFIRLLINLGLSDSLRLNNLESGSGRIVAWSFAWNHILDNTFIFGKGLGYDDWIMAKNSRALSKLNHEGGVHNSYLILWLNTGLIGLLSFLSGLIILFLKGMKLKSYSFPLLLTVIISSNFEPWISASLNPYTVVLLISLTIMLKINVQNKTS